MSVDKFQRGSGCYVCRACGKRTRDTGHAETSVRLCRKCFEDGGIENEHADGMHANRPHADCPACETEGEARK